MRAPAKKIDRQEQAVNRSKRAKQEQKMTCEHGYILETKD
jgi:hypothetical protein